MDQADSFCHAYHMKKPNMSWECHSIYSAYENYCWPFRYHDPITGESISGHTFDKSAVALSCLSQGLRRSLEDGDPEACRKHCYAVLQWGGVLSENDKRIKGLGDSTRGRRFCIIESFLIVAFCAVRILNLTVNRYNHY